MKKILLGLFIMVVALSASAGWKDFYTNWLGGTGNAMNPAAVDTAYFQVNPMTDTVMTFVQLYASTSTPQVSCTLYSTADDIQPSGTSTEQKLGRQASWATIAQVFSGLSTESSILFYGLTQANLMSKPGKWYALRYTAGASHDSTGVIQKAGVIWYPKPD